MELNRRSFLKGAGLLTLGGILMPETTLAASSKKYAKTKKTIGLQTYSLGPELSGNKVAEGLRRLRSMGYKNLELAGYNGAGQVGGIAMKEWKKIALARHHAGTLCAKVRMVINAIEQVRRTRFLRDNAKKATHKLL